MSLDKQAVQEIKKIDSVIPVLEAHVNTESGVVMVPEGYQLKDLEQFADTPRRIKQKPQLQSLDSFLAYVEAHKTPSSVIFFDEDNKRAEFISDYHDLASDITAPQHCDHRAVYVAKLDERWVRWTRADQDKFGQEELAVFIERQIKDFIDPDGSTMLTLAENFQVKKNVSYGKAVNLANGDIQFAYTSEDGAGTVEVPREFTVGIPMFKNGEAYSIKAKFRYRLREANIIFSFELMHLDDIEQDAVNSICTKLGESGLPVYLGTL